jgi:hypothetical protein
MSELVGQPAGTMFGPVKQVDAGLLNVGYVEAGPAWRTAYNDPGRTR